jgi:hypothetical protein
LYGLLTVEPLKRVAAAYPAVAVMAYLDDMVLLCPNAVQAEAATQMMATELARVGQMLSPRKT